MSIGGTVPLALPGFPGASSGAQGEGGQIGLSHIGNVFRRRRGVILGIIGGAVALTSLMMATETPIYQATAMLKMDIPVAADGTERVVPTAESEMQIETETRTLVSHDLARDIVRDLELLDNPAFSGRKISKGKTARASASRIDKAADRLLSMVQIQRVAHTQLISVSVRSPHPVFAAMVANRYAQVRQMHGALDRLRRQDSIAAALADRTRKAGDELRKAEQAVADFRRENHMLVGSAGPGDLNSLNQITTDAAAASSARAAAMAKAHGVSVATQIRPSADSATSPLLNMQEQRYAELQQRQAELSAFYGPGHPSLANVMAQIAIVKENMDAERARVRRTAAADAAANASREAYLARSDAESASARESAIQGYLGSLTAKAYQNTAANVRLAELERSAETQRALYVGLSGRLKQVGSALVSGTGLVLQSTAPVPRAPISPTPRKTLMVVLVGSTIIAFACAFALEMTDQRLRSSDQILRLFGLRSFAMFPMRRGGMGKTTARKLIKERPNSIIVEAARSLHNEVMRLRHGPGAQVVLITSPLQGDGKTSVAHSLGAAAIAAGRSAVVVDLDLRRGAPVDDGSSSSDLVTFLDGSNSVRGQLPSPDSSSGRELTVLAAHKQVRDPSALISSPQLERLFNDLRNTVDLVIIDAPPALAAADAANAAVYADLTLLVVRWSQTRIDELSAALSVLREPVAGVIMNAIDFDRYAQGRYGDSIQYYRKSSSYFQQDQDLVIPGPMDRFLRKLRSAYEYRARSWNT